MKEYLLIQVAAAAAIGIAAWRTLPETMMCAACGQLQRRRSFQDDGCIDGRHPGGQLRPGMAADPLVSETAGRPGVVSAERRS